MLPLLTEAGKFFPRTVPTGPCKEVIQRDNFSLLDFPILQCWPKDAGRFITLPCVTTRDPEIRQAQSRHVPDAGLRRAHDRNALAAPESCAEHFAKPCARGPRMRARLGCPQAKLGARPPAPSTSWRAPPAARVLPEGDRPVREDGSRGRHRHRPGRDFFRDRSRATRDRGIPDRRLPARSAGRSGEVRNGRPGSSGIERNRARRLCESRRTPQRRPVRRPHRLLFARRSLSRLPRHLHHAPEGSDLRDHDRGQAAAGRRLHGQGGRAHLFCR